MKLSSHKDGLIERLAATLAFASLFCVILLPSKPRLWPDSLGDFKIVYASASGLLHSGDAYGSGEFRRVYRDAGVVEPPDWFGRNPVYPFFTLITIWPVLLLPMLPAAYAWGCMGYLVVALTSLRLGRYAERQYGLGLGWRLAIIALVAASPLVSFGLELANLSVVSSCLCIFAVTAEPEEDGWLHAGALALALLLKPHLAFWIVAALFLLRRKRERTVAWRGCVLFIVAVLAMTGYLAWRHQLLPLLASYVDMLHREAIGGSMDFRNHQAFLAPAQITALGMLLGYWLTSLHEIAVLQLIILPVLGLALLWASLRVSSEWKLVLVSVWASFGFLVTYHRAHDGIVLLLFLPWALARLRNCWHDGSALSVLGIYFLFSIDVPNEWWRDYLTFAPLRPLGNLLFDRQVATAAFLLCVCLIFLVVRAAYLQLAPLELPPTAELKSTLEPSET